MIEKEQMHLLQCIAQEIFDKKGFNILTLDVRSCPTMADFVVIGEATADVHVRSVAKSILESLEQKGAQAEFIQGQQEGDWVVLDFYWLVVHLFKPGLREKYDLESLWKESEIVDVPVTQPTPFSV